jgi:CheY-like chemotaxis protein/anti-sigma regulatory factor (Ser/Thr protein kinase)
VKVTETIDRNGKAQPQLIEDLLDTSRIINGKMKLELLPVEPVAIISESLDTVRPSADSKGVVVLTDLDPEAGQLTGDPDRLQQVVWNLLSNAIKFTPGGGRVRIELRRGGAGVQIVVSDTGRGISPDLLPYVFDHFKQGDAEFSRRHGGLGLGLALVKHLVELHGGTVVVESPGVGQGATFIVNLPVRAVKAVTSAERGETEANRYAGRQTRTTELEGVRALVVDDEPGARELLSATLEQYGVLVTGVDSTEAALAAIESQFGSEASEAFDILISDIGMPGGDGYELMKQLRTHTDERVKRIRAIALTAYGRTEDRLRALQAGFQMHVPKPIDEEELTTVITALIDCKTGLKPSARRMAHIACRSAPFLRSRLATSRDSPQRGRMCPSCRDALEFPWDTPSPPRIRLPRLQKLKLFVFSQI